MSELLLLIAEDNIVNQKVAMLQLQKLGYKADAVNNGQEAIDALQTKPYDLVFMDCQMPVMDGYAATREIRRLEGEQKHTLIVAMTANALVGDREKCLEAGMDDYLSKPVTPEALATLLARVVAKIKAEKAEKAEKATPESQPAPLPATTSEPAPEPLLVDVESMRELMGDELPAVFEMYLEETSVNIDQLTTAIEAGDVQEVGRLAHSCVGTSGTCGIVGLAPVFRELEKQARAGSLANAPEILVRIKEGFGQVSAIIESEVASLT
jgi:two-component system sensor histidine kinase/response regulator